VASKRLCDHFLSEMVFPCGGLLCGDRSGGGSSLVESAPPFVFPPLSTAEMTSPVTLAAPQALSGLLCGEEISVSSFPSLSGAS
jgi:hypothetical protein